MKVIKHIKAEKKQDDRIETTKEQLKKAKSDREKLNILIDYLGLK